MKFKLYTLLAGIALSVEAITPDYVGRFLSSTNNCLTVNKIVIGGGTTGLALATRLSDNNNYNILVLEAGDR